MNITRTFVERWNYIGKWKLMDLSREPYGCVRHVDDSACLQSSENILQVTHFFVRLDGKDKYFSTHYPSPRGTQSNFQLQSCCPWLTAV